MVRTRKAAPEPVRLMVHVGHLQEIDDESTKGVMIFCVGAAGTGLHGF
jgi:hypothetical protein